MLRQRGILTSIKWGHKMTVLGNLDRKGLIAAVPSSFSTSAAAATSSSSSATDNRMEVDGGNSSPSAIDDITKRIMRKQDEIDAITDPAKLKQLWEAMPKDERVGFPDNDGIYGDKGKPHMSVYRDDLKSQQASLERQQAGLRSDLAFWKEERDRLEKQSRRKLCFIVMFDTCCSD